MSHWTTLARLLRNWRRLIADRGGNVTITFGLAFIPLVGLVGAAVDYSRASAIRTAMQSAADAAALAVARNAATQTTEQIQSQADSLFRASFTRTDVDSLVVTSAYSTVGGSNLTVSATATMKTDFLRIMGITEMVLGAKAVSTWGTTRLRVALVLDTTGSMDNAGKMTALKTATNSLLDQLKAAATVNGDVYVSIIPFSKNVNLDPVNHNAGWIDWTDWEAEPAVLRNAKPSNWDFIGPGSDCPFSNSSHGFRCAPDPTSTSTTSTIPSSGAYAGYICPGTDSGQLNATRIGIQYNGCYDSVPKPPKVIATGSSASCSGYSNCTCSGSGSDKTCTQTFPGQYDHTWIVNAHSTWNGCVTDRGTSSAPYQDLDRLVTAPDSTATSKYPAEQNAYCSPVAMGLSYDWTAMKTLVNNLYPLGATNQPIGLVWGWQSLVGGGPFTSPAKAAGYTYQEAIILMSDGLNTLDRWYGNGSSTSASVDRRMYDSTNNGVGTCANIKAAGITIYTIHVNTDGDPTSTLLRNCASDASKFWMITSANQLVTVFNQIGTNLSKLRLAK